MVFFIVQSLFTEPENSLTGSSNSRHNCGFLQEGLSCDITFNGLYCHPLAKILAFINS